MAEVVQVGPEPHGRLARFLAGFPGQATEEAFWIDRFRVWWDENPAARSGVPRGWMLHSGGQIVGFLGNIPSLVQLGGREAIACNATTWRVLPAYRNQSLELMARLMGAARESILFDTSPTDEVALLLEAMGFERLPTVGDRASLVVIDARRLLGSVYGRNRMMKFGARQLLAPVVAAVQSVRLRRGRQSRLAPVRELRRADAGFDRLWQRTRLVHPTTNVRTAEAVNWYCFAGGGTAKTVLGCYRDEELAGYLVLRVRAGSGFSVLECLDLWSEPLDVEVVASLVDAASALARRRALEAIVLPHTTKAVRSCFRRMGLLEWAYRERPAYFKLGRGAAPGAMMEGASCFLRSQGDRGL